MMGTVEALGEAEIRLEPCRGLRLYGVSVCSPCCAGSVNLHAVPTDLPFKKPLTKQEK